MNTAAVLTGRVNSMPFSRPPLSLGILLDAPAIPAWMYHALERVLRSGCAEIKVLVRNSGTPRASDPLSPKPGRGSILFRLLTLLDEYLFGRKPDPFRERSIYPLLSGIPIIEANAISGSDSRDLDAATVAKIREYRLDILIHAGSSPAPGAFRPLCRYGIWYYRHTDDSAAPGTPAGFWEVVNHASVTCPSLRAMGGESPLPPVLYRARFFTHPLSPARNRSYFFWAASAFLPRQIELLHRQGEQVFLREIARFSGDTGTVSGAPAGVPSNVDVLRLIPRITARLVGTAMRRLLFQDQWFLLYTLETVSRSSYENFRPILPPKDRFWADPMVVYEKGRYYVFLEELLYTSNRGHLSVLEMDREGLWKEPVPILKTDYHLSYPFVFKWQDKYFLVPESAENRTIDLYECTKFPHEWRFASRLMEDVIAVDTTLVFASGKWWLFTAMAEHEGAHPQIELFLFFADSLFGGRWEAHPQNPIISDIETARPAGRIFSRGDRIYRPSQITSGTYGSGFNINEIEVLSETEYREKTVTSVRPDWDSRIRGMHTYATEGNLTLVDAVRRRRRIF